jgi:hypothetical protein
MWASPVELVRTNLVRTDGSSTNNIEFQYMICSSPTNFVIVVQSFLKGDVDHLVVGD